MRSKDLSVATNSKVTTEALVGPNVFGWDLMASRAGNTIGGESRQLGVSVQKLLATRLFAIDLRLHRRHRRVTTQALGFDFVFPSRICVHLSGQYRSSQRIDR
jgi:hypothetical protein